MSKPFYRSRARQGHFLSEALSWKGKKFLLNGRAKEGVGCGGLQAEIHYATGALPRLELPMASGKEGDQRRIRTMSKWMANLPYFEEANPDHAEIGDIVTFKAMEGEFHLGGFMGIIGGTPRSIITALPHYGVSVVNLLDPTYHNNLVACWRVVE